MQLVEPSYIVKKVIDFSVPRRNVTNQTLPVAGIILFLQACLHVSSVDSLPLPLRVAKAGKNHLNGEISPPPPHWDRREI